MDRDPFTNFNSVSHDSSTRPIRSLTSTTSHKKPYVVLSSGIVAKANWKFFVPNDQSTLQPDGVPCRTYSMVYSIVRL